MNALRQNMIGHARVRRDLFRRHQVHHTPGRDPPGQLGTGNEGAAVGGEILLAQRRRQRAQRPLPVAPRPRLRDRRRAAVAAVNLDRHADRTSRPRCSAIAMVSGSSPVAHGALQIRMHAGDRGAPAPAPRCRRPRESDRSRARSRSPAPTARPSPARQRRGAAASSYFSR